MKSRLVFNFPLDICQLLSTTRNYCYSTLSWTSGRVVQLLFVSWRGNPHFDFWTLILAFTVIDASFTSVFLFGKILKLFLVLQFSNLVLPTSFSGMGMGINRFFSQILRSSEIRWKESSKNIAENEVFFKNTYWLIFHELQPFCLSISYPHCLLSNQWKSPAIRSSKNTGFHPGTQSQTLLARQERFSPHLCFNYTADLKGISWGYSTGCQNMFQPWFYTHCRCPDASKGVCWLCSVHEERKGQGCPSSSAPSAGLSHGQAPWGKCI